MLQASEEEREFSGLMVRYQGGDAYAVDELVRLLSPRLFRFLGGGSTSPQDTEDVFQECWIRVHRARHSWRPGESVLPWLYAIARHTKLDAWRRRKTRMSRETQTDEIPELPAPAPVPVSEAGHFETLLLTLPDSQREVLLMMKVSGMTLEEVARATGSTVGSVKQKAHRAYTTLRKQWKKDGDLSCQVK